MNKITATGRIVADAELRATSAGDSVCQFRLASDVGYGERKSTNWFNCQIWGRRAEGIVEHIRKGTPVTVFGTLTMREWTNKDGLKQLSPEIRIDEIELHGSRDSGAQNESRTPQAQQRSMQAPQRQPTHQAGGAHNDMDEIPFMRAGYGATWRCI